MTDLRPLSSCGLAKPMAKTADLCPPVYYAGCLDSDPYFCLKQCDRVIAGELRRRGVHVRELQDDLPKGNLFRKINRNVLYPALVAKVTRKQRSEIRNQPSSDLRPLTSSLPPVFHIGSQCYSNLIPAVIRRQRSDVSGQQGFDLRLPSSDLRSPVSITVHDVAEFDYPEGYTPSQFRRWKKRIDFIKDADLIFTVSEFTRQELVQKAGVPAEKIRVNYNGVDPEFRGLNESEIPVGLRNALGSGFKVLAVGADLYRKNLPTLLKSVEELGRRGVKVTLVKTGDPIPKNLTPKTENLNLINLGHVPKAELIALYNLCDVLTFPSLYEGFGMPVVEAQRCGLPCVISNTSSLPEVGGDGALYHDPLDVEGLAGQLQRIYKDQNVRNDLREKGFKNAERFSWERHVDVLIEGVASFNVDWISFK